MASIPGPTFTTISGKIKSVTTGPTTERLLIIGTAVDGPLNKPIQITDPTLAQRVFGPANYSKGYLDPNTSTESGEPNGATLPLAFAQAMAAGCTDIWLCRATGTYATASTAFDDKLDITAINPGRIYNEVTLTATSTGGNLELTLSQPIVKGGIYVTEYASSLTIGEVIDLVNEDRRNKTIFIERNTFASKLASACTILSPGTGSVAVTLSGGTNGTDAKGEDYETSKTGFAAKLATATTGTFDTLYNYPVPFDIAVLTGIYIDDQIIDSGSTTAATIATDFIFWLDKMSVTVSPCHGVIACRPPNIRNTATLRSYVSDALLATTAGAYNASARWNKAGYFLNSGWTRTDPVAGTIDLGQRMSVVAGPQVVYSHPDVGRYADNFHVSYAALLTTYPPERVPLNKGIPGIVAYGTPFPNDLVRSMLNGIGYDRTVERSGKGAYVLLGRNPRNVDGPLVIVDTPTVTARDDFMYNYQLVHLVNSVHNSLWDDLYDFIGGPTDLAARASMETAIQNRLDGYVESGGLAGPRGQGYDFAVTMDGIDEKLGVVRVHIELRPTVGLREIHFVVQVRE